MRIIAFLCLSLISIVAYAREVCIPYEDYIETVDVIDRSAHIINLQHQQLHHIRNERPIIEYTVVDGNIIVQRIIINVPYDNPIVYRNVIAFGSSISNNLWFPFRLLLVGGIESISNGDVKLGIQFFSLQTLTNRYVRNFSSNILLGFESINISISYQLPPPISNTTIHIYSGTRYSLNLERVFGVGIGVFF